MKKPKDIVILTAAIVVICVTVFLAYNLIFPNTNSQTNQQNQATSGTKYLNPNVDNKTYLDLSKLSLYPVPALTDIGRTDLFAAPANVQVTPQTTTNSGS